MRDEVEKLKSLLQEQKNVASANNENINKKLNEFVERDNTRFGQLNTVIDLLIKENQEMKNIIQNQRFVIQPINPYNIGPGSSDNSTSGPSGQIIGGNQQHIPHPPPPGAANTINPFQDPSFLPNGANAAANPQGVPQQSPNNHHPPAQSTPHQQQIPPQQQQNLHHQQQQQQQHHHPAQVPNGHTPVLDNNSINDHNAQSGSMIRFINNQYVDDTEAQINAANNHGTSNHNQRIDFVFMDPSANKRSQYRVHSNSLGSSNVSGRHDDDSMTSGSDTQITLPTSTNTSTTANNPIANSRLQRINNRTDTEFEAENYDLIIHNDFNKVEDVYFEYYNSLKPQVEKVSKAYKVKKIRKYQKIKALAVRIDRYKKLKNCSLEESFNYFENLRLGNDNRKKSVAWLYNSLPDVLKKVGLDDQLKKFSSNPNDDDD